MRGRPRLWLALGVLAGCGGGGGGNSGPDAAVESCGQQIPGGTTAAELTAALAQAGPGDCVTIGSATCRGSFVVPAGRKLLAQPGTTPKLEGDRADAPALELSGATPAVVSGITVNAAAGVGVLVSGGAATLRGVRIQGAMSWALWARCDGGGCLAGDRAVLLSGVTIQYNQSGILAEAVKLDMAGGQVSDSAGQTASTGYGIVAKQGAAVAINGVAVERNQADGVLVDGTGGTVAQLVDVQVSGNLGRGVWAQGLRGSMAAPALSISGSATLFDANHFAGVGAVDSLGIIVVNGSVKHTVSAMASDGAGGLFAVGDGIGLFGNSGLAEVRDVSLNDNARAQMLVDHGGAGIIVVNGQVARGTGMYRVVVQNTPVHSIPADLIDDTSASPLKVAAGLQAVP